MSVGDDTLRSVDLQTNLRDPLLDTVVGGYRVQAVLGSGAMGIVYRAVHQVIGKVAALKVLKPDFADDEAMVKRLREEARTVNAIRHPGIVDIFDFGSLPSGQPYIVMDLLEGEPLDAFIKREAPMKLKVAQPIIDQLLSALWAAHNVGVVHRDLKPQNIFLEAHVDRAATVKLLDFGLARQADKAGGSIRPTNPGTLLGTPAFMAPEQVMGQKVSPATDLYAVGGMLYQMLTGHLPHEGPSAIEVLSQKMQHDPLSVRKWAPQLSEELDTLILSLLKRDEPDRPQSADEVRKRLKALTEARKTGQAAAHTPSRQPVLPSTKPLGSAGVVPRRAWQEARTILVENVAASPDPTGSEPTNTSEDSPFRQSAGGVLLTPSLLGDDAAPRATPDAPRTLPAYPALSPQPELSPPRPWEQRTSTELPVEAPPAPLAPPSLMDDETLPPTDKRAALEPDASARWLGRATIIAGLMLLLAAVLAGYTWWEGR